MTVWDNRLGGRIAGDAWRLAPAESESRLVQPFVRYSLPRNDSQRCDGTDYSFVDFSLYSAWLV